jgi:putative salt-induced outer membrane protein YdiY
MSIDETLYFQPRWDSPRDFRLLNESSLVVVVKGKVSVKISSSMRYDREPPLGVKKLDLGIRNTLSLQF